MAAPREGGRSEADGVRCSRTAALVAGAVAAFDASAHGGPTGGEWFAILIVPMTGILCAFVAPLFAMTGDMGERLGLGFVLAIFDFVLWVLVIATIGSIREAVHPFPPPWLGPFSLFAMAASPYALPAIFVWEMRRRRRKTAP